MHRACKRLSRLQAGRHRFDPDWPTTIGPIGSMKDHLPESARTDDLHESERKPADESQALFSALANGLLADPNVTRSTMMGYPCLRFAGAFFACAERSTGHLIVKLPSARVAELIGAGDALPFAPAGRVFREWAAIPRQDETQWAALMEEAREFVTH